MEGTELLILQACNSVAADEHGFVVDEDLARHTQMSVTDVRDYLESLEQDEFISLVRLASPDGLKAHVEAKGRTELSKHRPFQEEPKEKQGQAIPIKIVPKGLRFLRRRRRRLLPRTAARPWTIGQTPREYPLLEGSHRRD